MAYDNSIDWKSRLEREMPFILSCIPSSKRVRILDIACGSGRHSVALALQGFEVVGIDHSQTMIQIARNHAIEMGVSPTFIVADMTQIRENTSRRYDLVICLGNSFALLENVYVLEAVLRDIFDLLEERGSLVLQVLNFEEIHWTGFRTFPTKTGKLSNGEDITFARLFEHTNYPTSSTLVMSAFRTVDRAWTSEVSTQKVLNLNFDLMRNVLGEAGFKKVEFYSDYMRNPFDRKYSRNMIIHAAK
ncbi:MAG: methyltransferase domain-containing protein [Candidatus Thorarchaeota archaeon]|nr:methyltransferase domain-containing protein [Candidatus Thorarchaeota archaeon]